MLKSDKIIFLIAAAEKMIPMIPKIIAATGIDKSPALLPCEFDAMATMMIDETTVAIADFFIIPTYSGRSPNRIADIVVTACASMFPKLNVTKSKHFDARKIVAYWKIFDSTWNRSMIPHIKMSFAVISFVRLTG